MAAIAMHSLPSGWTLVPINPLTTTKVNVLTFAPASTFELKSSSNDVTVTVKSIQISLYLSCVDPLSTKTVFPLCCISPEKNAASNILLPAGLDEPTARIPGYLIVIRLQ